MGQAIAAGDVRAFRCFGGFSDAEAGAVARLLEPLRLARGETLFHQDDAGDTIYLLVAGLLEIRVRVPGEEGHLCATLEAGALCVEIGPLLDERRKASAVAGTD